MVRIVTARLLPVGSAFDATNVWLGARREGR
jgi:hypothetical protein